MYTDKQITVFPVSGQVICKRTYRRAEFVFIGDGYRALHPIRFGGPQQRLKLGFRDQNLLPFFCCVL